MGETMDLENFPKQAMVSHLAKKFSLLECEEMGTGQPRRCQTCSACNKCSVRSVEMTRKEQEELAIIEENISVDLFNGQVTFKYLYIKDINLLHDNRRHTISIASKLEARLKAKSELADYNKELQEFIGRGVLRELTKEELENWEGPINYNSHYGVLKPGSTTTKLRVVSNSSLDNNNSGLSLNDCLPKGPNTLVPLIQSIIAWGSYQQCVMWDFSKAYNVMHLRRLVWRWGDEDTDWLSFSLTRMHFGDRCAMCGLEVTKA